MLEGDNISPDYLYIDLVNREEDEQVESGINDREQIRRSKR